MQKIMSLFQRLREADPVRGRLVYEAVTEGAEWVIRGEGIATRKWDGVAVLIKDGSAFMRYDLKQGRQAPAEFIPAQAAPDPKTGHWPGWVPADCPAGKHVMEAVNKAKQMWEDGVPDGTYEACGPKIGTRHGANPEKLTEHVLIPHGKDVIEDAPRTFAGLKEFLQARSIEGIVWHHEDGRMVKIKKADFPL
jgi:hypothetical protein